MDLSSILDNSKRQTILTHGYKNINDEKSHAFLSASGSHRWLHCTPSARLCEKLEEPREYQGIAASQGTDAHELSEFMLKQYFDNSINIDRNKLIFYDKDMEDHCQKYKDFVLYKYDRLQPAKLHIEEKTNFSNWVPDGFGTCDISITSEDYLYLIDFKYGRVRVEVNDNPQLKLYALGLISKFYRDKLPKQIMFTIYQPRIDNINSYSVDPNDLLKWADDYVRPRAQMAYDGTGKLEPGEWCKYCKGCYYGK